MMKPLRFALIFALSLAFLQGCFLFKNKRHKSKDINRVGKYSSKTGARYNEDGNFIVKDYRGQEAAPGLVFIEGGTFILGNSEEDVTRGYDARNRQVTVASYYIDESEVSNVDWKEFLFEILKDSGETKWRALLPDTSVWERELAYNDPYIQYYFGHEGFNTYPVVGVNWYQAQEYCKWRTVKVNKLLTDKDPEAVTFPSYRLPSEAEWEYAARGGLENEIYPWEGKSLRNGKNGKFLANFKRGRGDYAGRSNRGGAKLAEGLNDGYMITSPVGAFLPNDFGLYNMAGNVAEWTFDTYRVLSYEDVEDLNPGRYQGATKDNVTSDDSYSDNTGGRLSLLHNPTTKFNARDKDLSKPYLQRGLYDNGQQVPRANSDWDNVKVYRGGSWADVAYNLSTGTRRFANAQTSSATIGFRCAMVRVGSPS